MPVSLTQTQAGAKLDAAALVSSNNVQITHCEIFSTRRAVDGSEVHATLAQLNPRRIYRATGDPVAAFPAAYIAQHFRTLPVANIITIAFREARLPLRFVGGSIGVYVNGVFNRNGALTNNGTLYALLSDPNDDVFIKAVNGSASFLGVVQISASVIATLPALSNYPVASESAFGLARKATSQQVASRAVINRYVAPEDMPNIPSSFPDIVILDTPPQGATGNDNRIFLVY